MIKVIENRLFWVAIIFISTLFVPWQTIYKGTRVFAVLPLWWEYARPIENYMVIIGHMSLSAITGVTVSLIVKKYINRVIGNAKNNNT